MDVPSIFRLVLFIGILAMLFEWNILGKIKIWGQTPGAQPKNSDRQGTPFESKTKMFSETEWMMQMESKYRKMRTRIESVCKDFLRKNPSEINNQTITMMKIERNIMFDIRHGQAYCRQAKVGTTTLLQLFMYLSDIVPRYKAFFDKTITSKSSEDLKLAAHVLHELVPGKFKIQPDYFLNLVENQSSGNKTFRQVYQGFMNENDILSFSFVRHPFERLFSAYEDKILGNSEVITGKHFRNGIYNNSEIQKFSTFVDHVLQQYKNSSCYNTHNSICYGVNIHWKPFNARCLYCEIPYDVIARLETFDEDIKYIILKRNLTSWMNKSGIRLHKNKDPELTLPDTANIQKSSEIRKVEKKRKIMKYFHELTKQQIDDLYRMYFFDFHLFNYSAKEYLEIHKTI